MTEASNTLLLSRDFLLSRAAEKKMAVLQNVAIIKRNEERIHGQIFAVVYPVCSLLAVGGICVGFVSDRMAAVGPL